MTAAARPPTRDELDRNFVGRFGVVPRYYSMIRSLITAYDVLPTLVQRLS